MGFCRIRGSILGVLRIRTILYWGLKLSPPKSYRVYIQMHTKCISIYVVRKCRYIRIYMYTQGVPKPVGTGVEDCRWLGKNF